MKGLVRFLKGYKLACFGVVVFMFVQVAAALLVPTLVAGIVNDGIVPGDVNHVWALGLAMLGAAAVSAAATLAGTYVSASIATGVSRDYGMCTVRESPSNAPSRGGGDSASLLSSREARSDVNQIQQALLVFIEMLLPVPFMVVIGMALMFSKDPVLAAGIVGVMIAIVVAFLVLSRVVIPYFERLQRQLDTMNLTVRESIAGVRIVRAFRRTGWDRLRMEVAAGDYAATAIKTNRIFAVVVPFVMLLFNATTFAILFVGGNQVAEGSLEIGDIMALVEYAMLVLGYLLMGVAMLIFIPQAQVSARRINEVLESEALPLGDDGASKKSPLGRGRRKREVAARQGRRERRCRRRATRTQLRSHCRTAGPRPTCRRIQGRRLFLRRSREPRAEGRELRGQPGRDHGHHRRNGLRKIHDREPSHGLFRSTSRRYSRRRKTPRLVPCNRPAQADRLRSAEAVLVQRDDPRTTCATALRVRPSGRCARRLPPLR